MRPTWPGNPAAGRELLGDLCETWFVSYNAPLQFERLLESIKATEPALLRTGRRVLINNSTDTASFGLPCPGNASGPAAELAATSASLKVPR